MSTWIFPLQIHNNIKKYAIENPLEYQQLVHDWCLTFNSPKDVICTILCKGYTLFTADVRNSINELTFMNGSHLVRMISNDGKVFHGNGLIMAHSKIAGLKPLHNLNFRSMIGITFFSTKKIVF